MNIEGRVTIERYSNGKLLERREIKNVVRQRLVEHITYYIWYRLAAETPFYTTVAPVYENVRHPLRLGIADTGKLTIKALDAKTLSKSTDTTAMKHVVRMSWLDDTTDEYTIGYLGIFLMVDTLTAGQDNITGSPGAMVAVRVDPPMVKASTETMTFTWDIIFPYSEVS